MKKLQNNKIQKNLQDVKQLTLVPGTINDIQLNFLKQIFDKMNDLFFEAFNQNLEMPFFAYDRSNRKNAAHFWPEKWSLNNEKIHEISLNPDFFSIVDNQEICKTLAHELCHQYHFCFERETYPKNAYHNKEFCRIMQAIGLQPSDTGQPNGKPIGRNMSEYILEGELFEKHYQESFQFLPFQLLQNFTPIQPKEKRKTNKTKYSCECTTIWAKPNLKNIHCSECNIFLMEHETE